MTAPAGPDLEQLLASMPFAARVGVVLDGARPEQVEGHLPWSPDVCTVGGGMHGGAIMTLADSVGAVCAFLNLPAGASTSTVASSTSLVRAVRDGRAVAVARPLNVGRSFIVVVVEVRDDQGRVAAQVTQTQAVLASSG